VLPVTAEVVDVARHLLDHYPALIARDAVHAAVYRHHSLDGICSYDRDFNRIEGVRRVEPRSGA
jgi:predicted nucleic acid-binding protein